MRPFPRMPLPCGEHPVSGYQIDGQIRMASEFVVTIRTLARRSRPRYGSRARLIMGPVALPNALVVQIAPARPWSGFSCHQVDVLERIVCAAGRQHVSRRGVDGERIGVGQCRPRADSGVRRSDALPTAVGGVDLIQDVLVVDRDDSLRLTRRIVERHRIQAAKGWRTGGGNRRWACPSLR